MRNTHFVLLLFCCYSLNILSQDKTFIDSISNLFIKQITIYPQEKIYLHTDKSTYISGETIWLRAHLSDAVLNKQANASRYVYIELLNPLGEIEEKIKIIPDSLGLFYGQIQLDENLIEGNYIVRSYTEYMRNLDQKYFCEKLISVYNPALQKIDLSLDFHFFNDMRISLQCTDKVNHEILPIKKAHIVLQNKVIKNLSQRTENNYETTFQFPDSEKSRNALIEVDVRGIKYKKYITIPYSKKTYIVDFFPEGGGYLFNVPLKIGVKAVNNKGLGESVTGYLKNEKGVQLAEFKTNELGMGCFTTDLKKEEQYIVEVKSQESEKFTFEFPIENYLGRIGLSSFWKNNMLNVSIKSNVEEVDDSLFLLLHSRGVPLYNEEIRLIDKVSFAHTQIPLGVSHLILYNQNKTILSERLIFNFNQYQMPKINFFTDKDNYKRRELVRAKLRLSDINRKSLSGNYSVSVIDNNDLAIDTTSTILSQLLLSSELKGHIESPAYYFSLPKEEAVLALDNLMLTQGWRRYNIPALLKGTIEEPVIKPELFQKIKGNVQGKFFSSKRNAQIKLIAIKGDFADFKLTQANEKGLFEFAEFEYPDSTLLLIEALTEKGKQSTVLTLDEMIEPKVISFNDYRLDVKKEDTDKFVNKAEQQYTMTHGMRMVDLDELVVTASKVKKKQLTSNYYSPLHSSNLLDSEDFDLRNITTLSSLLFHLGVSMRGDTPMIRNNPVQVIVDDLIAEEGVLDMIFFEDIESAFVNKDGIGIINMKPSIVFTTKRGEGAYRNSISDNIKQIKPLGYQQKVEFYSPQYDVEEKLNNSTPDLRTTLYWNPSVLINEQGNSSFNFYAADASTSYTVIVEGLSDEGHILYYTQKINRNK